MIKTNNQNTGLKRLHKNTHMTNLEGNHRIKNIFLDIKALTLQVCLEIIHSQINTKKIIQGKEATAIIRTFKIIMFFRDLEISKNLLTCLLPKIENKRECKTQQIYRRKVRYIWLEEILCNSSEMTHNILRIFYLLFFYTYYLTKIIMETIDHKNVSSPAIALISPKRNRKSSSLRKSRGI